MKICTSNRKYNPVTLKPKTREDRELFWTFRSEDIAVIYSFYIVVMALLYIVIVLRVKLNYDAEVSLPCIAIYTC